MKGGKSEIKKFADAWNGIMIFIRTGQHAKFHVFAAVVVIICGYYFKVTRAEWSAVFLCIGLVLITEAVNTAIEMICDFVHAEHHPQIGRIKDIAAGAVLMAAITAAICGCIIFIPYILKL